MKIATHDKTPTQNTPVPATVILIWVLILIVIPAIVFFRTKIEISSFPISRQKLEAVLASDAPIKGKIYYPPPGGSLLTEISGTYITTNAHGYGVDNFFRLKTRLSPSLEAALLDRGLEAVEQNNLFMSLFVTFLPILLVAGLIYFFFNRQIKMARTRIALPASAQLSKLDIFLLESELKPTVPAERTLARIFFSNAQILEGQILWADPKYLKFQNPADSHQSIFRKSAIWKIELL